MHALMLTRTRCQKISLLTRHIFSNSLQNLVLKWLKKYCQRGWDDLFLAQLHLFWWQHVDTQNKAVCAENLSDIWRVMERTLSHPTGRFLLVGKVHFEPQYEVTLLVKMNIISSTQSLLSYPFALLLCFHPSQTHLSFFFSFALRFPAHPPSSSSPPCKYLHPMFMWLLWLFFPLFKIHNPNITCISLTSSLLFFLELTMRIQAPESGSHYTDFTLKCKLTLTQVVRVWILFIFTQCLDFFCAAFKTLNYINIIIMIQNKICTRHECKNKQNIFV